MKLVAFWKTDGGIVRMTSMSNAAVVPNHGIDIDNRDVKRIVVVSGKTEWKINGTS